MAKEADLFAEVQDGVHTCTNKGQLDNRGGEQNHSNPAMNKAGQNRRLSVVFAVKDI